MKKTKKQYKHRFLSAMIGEIKNMEQYYAEMARQGWMLDKINMSSQRFRAIEPCEKRFYVDILPQITALDYPENRDAQDYRALCEASGWRFIAANKQYHVFCADESAEPVPIHTDNSIHAKIYLKACRKYELPTLFVSALMLIFLLYMGNISRGIELFFSNLSIFSAVGLVFFMVGHFWTLGFSLRWYFRTKKSAKHGMPMPAVNRRMSAARRRVFWAGAVIYFLCMVTGLILEFAGAMSRYYYMFLPILLLPFLAIAIGLSVRLLIDKKRRSRAANIVLFAVSVFIVTIVIIIGQNLVIGNIFASTDYIFSDSIGDRPVLRLEDDGVAGDADSDPFTIIGGSIAVPVNYLYHEDSAGGVVRNEVLRSVSKTLTNWLFDHYVAEFKKEDLKSYERHYSKERDEIIDLTPEEAALWGAQRGMVAYSPYGGQSMILQNGKTLLKLNISSGVDADADTLYQAVRRLWAELEG